MGFIYKITNTINDKVYIGQTSLTLEKRFKGHLYHAKREPVTAIHHAMKAHGYENFGIELLREVPDKHMNLWEVAYIKRLESMSPDGYNMRSGGGQRTVLAEASKQKISAALMGHIPWNKGKKMSIQMRENIRQGHLGLVYPTRRKPVEQICLTTGKVLNWFATQTEAIASVKNRNVAAVCRGERRQAAGFGWRFAISPGVFAYS